MNNDGSLSKGDFRDNNYETPFIYPAHCFINFNEQRYDERIENLCYINNDFDLIIAYEELSKNSKKYATRPYRIEKAMITKKNDKLKKIMDLDEELENISFT